MLAGPGRPPKERSFANMLNIAINEATKGGGTKLRAVADKLVELAIAGDMQAIKEIGDRIDGKPVQVTEGPGEGGAFKHELTVRFVG